MGRVFFVGGKPGMKSPGGRLPKGYTELSFIQSSGAQYIDLGISGRLPLLAEVDVQTLTGTASADNVLLGSSDGTNFSLFVYWYSGKWFLDVGRGNGTSGGSLADNTRYTAVINATATAQSLTVNGTAVVQKTASATGSTKNLFLFARNNNGASSAYASARIYSLRFSTSGTLIRDFVPCVTDGGEVGLFDLVNSKFYGNAGTGSFIGGEEV